MSDSQVDQRLQYTSVLFCHSLWDPQCIFCPLQVLGPSFTKWRKESHLPHRMHAKVGWEICVKLANCLAPSAQSNSNSLSDSSEPSVFPNPPQLSNFLSISKTGKECRLVIVPVDRAPSWEWVLAVGSPQVCTSCLSLLEDERKYTKT